MARKNLVGQKFGMLTVIDELGDKVLCRCDCGTEKIAARKNVMRGQVSTCGGTVHRVKSVVGKRFGRLTVIKELGNQKILCRCDCGTEKIINKSNVTSGKVISCGCASFGRYVAPAKNLVGQRFGRLVVLEELTRGRVKVHCDCGKDKNVNKGHLINGDIKSCGCLMAEHIKAEQKKQLFSGTNISMLKSSRPTKRNISGVRGVSKGKTPGTWRAGICIRNTRIHLGTFHTIEEAATARAAAEKFYSQPIIEEWEEMQREKKGGENNG